MDTIERWPLLVIAILVVTVAIHLRELTRLILPSISLWLEGRRPLPVVGGLYSVPERTGHFVVAKVLAIDTDAVHVRSYQNRFAFRPERVDPAWLWIGEASDEEWRGMSHVALTYAEFRCWRPRLITKTDVSEQELQACRVWHRSGRWIQRS